MDDSSAPSQSYAIFEERLEQLASSNREIMKIYGELNRLERKQVDLPAMPEEHDVLKVLQAQIVHIKNERDEQLRILKTERAASQKLKLEIARTKALFWQLNDADRSLQSTIYQGLENLMKSIIAGIGRDDRAGLRREREVQIPRLFLRPERFEQTSGDIFEMCDAKLEKGDRFWIVQVYAWRMLFTALIADVEDRIRSRWKKLLKRMTDKRSL